MPWASSRRILILLVIFSIAAVVVAGVLFVLLYEKPSCSDGEQNQNETGVDCGGACAKVCTPTTIPPVVSFVRAVPGPYGRTDIVAHIENKNVGVAAKEVAYEIELYDANNIVVASTQGILDLPPASSVPLFIPNVYNGATPVVRAFLSIEEGEEFWYRYEEETRTIPEVEDIEVGDTTDSPRVTARLTNPSPNTLYNVKVVATVFDEDDNALAASQTILSELRGGEGATATFTWGAPFKRPYARIDVRPIVPLPNLTERI